MYGFEDHVYHVLKLFGNQLHPEKNDRAIVRVKDSDPLCSVDDAMQTVSKAANAVMEMWSSLLTSGCRGRIVLLVGLGILFAFT